MMIDDNDDSDYVDVMILTKVMSMTLMQVVLMKVLDETMCDDG